MGLISFFRNGFVKCRFDTIDQHGLGKFALFLNRNFVNWGTGDQFLFDAFQRRFYERIHRCNLVIEVDKRNRFDLVFVDNHLEI